MSFSILTDSSCALPATLGQGFSAGDTPVFQVPLEVSEVGGRVTTSQPSRQALIAALDAASDGGARRVIAPVLSSRVSGTAAALSAIVAEGDYPCDIIDTRTVGGAIGLAVLAATRQADAAGALAVIRELVAKSRTAIVVADLKPLVAGGRLRAPTASIGTALGIVPVIEMRDGELKLADAVRGQARARSKMISRVLGARQRGGMLEEIDVVCHEGAEHLLADELEQFCAAAGVRIRHRYDLPLPAVLEAHTGACYWGLCVTPVLAGDIHPVGSAT